MPTFTVPLWSPERTPPDDPMDIDGPSQKVVAASSPRRRQDENEGDRVRVPILMGRLSIYDCVSAGFNRLTAFALSVLGWTGAADTQLVAVPVGGERDSRKRRCVSRKDLEEAARGVDGSNLRAHGVFSARRPQVVKPRLDKSRIVALRKKVSFSKAAVESAAVKRALENSERRQQFAEKVREYHLALPPHQRRDFKLLSPIAEASPRPSEVVGTPVKEHLARVVDTPPSCGQASPPSVGQSVYRQTYQQHYHVVAAPEEDHQIPSAVQAASSTSSIDSMPAARQVQPSVEDEVVDDLVLRANKVLASLQELRNTYAPPEDAAEAWKREMLRRRAARKRRQDKSAQRLNFFSLGRLQSAIERSNEFALIRAREANEEEEYNEAKYNEFEAARTKATARRVALEAKKEAQKEEARVQYRPVILDDIRARTAQLEAARQAQQEAARQAQEEAARQVQEAAELAAKVEAERQEEEAAALAAEIEAERKAKEEAELAAKLEAERKAKQEEEEALAAKVEAERKAKEEAEFAANANARGPGVFFTQAAYRKERDTVNSRDDTDFFGFDIETPPEWATKIREVFMSNGDSNEVIAKAPDGSDLKRSTFHRILSDGNSGTASWLDDDAVNAFLQALVNALNEKVGWTRESNKPQPFYAYNSTWWLKANTDKNVRFLAQWARRRGRIHGMGLLEAQCVLFPVNTGAHWTIMVIDGRHKTIHYFDSLLGDGKNIIAYGREFIQRQLDAEYKAEEWSVSRSRSSKQANMNDCGVFACFNGAAQALNMPTSTTVQAMSMALHREQLAAVLLNGGFKGDYELHLGALLEQADAEGVIEQ